MGIKGRLEDWAYSIVSESERVFSGVEREK
jgi:hypothetical protein